MIKFFRNIRKKLLSENRFNKYLIYAFGEIILVVIGILIALQINNWNESKKNREKVDKLLFKIQKDIKSDIGQIKSLTKFYAEKDSLIQLVLNDQITRKDYESRGSDPLHLLIFNKEFVRLKKDSYSNLLSLQDVIPSEYDVILEDLQVLYNELFSYVKNREEQFDNKTSKYDEMLFEKYDWYSKQISRRENQKRIDYFLSNDRYKGLVSGYRSSGINNFLRITIAYAIKAISVYGKIDEILKDKSLDSDLNLQLNSEFYGNYMDLYYNQPFEILRHGNRTFTKSKDSVEVFPYAKNKIISNRFSLRFQKKKDSTFIFLNAPEFEFGKKPFAYKID